MVTMDFRKRQTIAASPAEPGDLPHGLDAAPSAGFSTPEAAPRGERSSGTGQEKINILLVDDQQAKLLSYEAILDELGENLIKASSAREALEQILKGDIAIILIDVCMPDLDGFQLAAMIREHPRFQSIAIIFVSAIQIANPDLLRGYGLGAVDYVPVPVTREILRAKVKVFVDLCPNIRDEERRDSKKTCLLMKIGVIDCRRSFTWRVRWGLRRRCCRSSWRGRTNH